MPTRAAILDTLAASQTQVLAFFHGLSPDDLERPATASDAPGAAPWRAKDHLAHLVQNERNPYNRPRYRERRRRATLQSRSPARASERGAPIRVRDSRIMEGLR